LLFTLAFIFVGTLAGGAAAALLVAFSATESVVAPIASFVALLCSALLAGWLCGRFLEGLPFKALGASFTGGWIKNFILGLIVGGLTFALAAGLGMLSGGLSFRFNSEADSTAIYSTLIISFLLFFAAAAFEEALFRGYILQTFVRSDLLLFGGLLTSLIFATVHNANPNWSMLSWLNTFLAGVWFVVAYLKTRDLWLPFGLHLAWNWTQGSIFGIEVSGLTEIVKAPLMRETDTGPTWITGGDYGVEGGIVTTIALIVSTVLIYFLPVAILKSSTDGRISDLSRGTGPLRGSS
jgi:membrane protease YdiL (CAAX protease family)